MIRGGSRLRQLRAQLAPLGSATPLPRGPERAAALLRCRTPAHGLEDPVMTATAALGAFSKVYGRELAPMPSEPRFDPPTQLRRVYPTTDPAAWAA